MEQIDQLKKPKTVTKKSDFENLRVTKETKKKVATILERINRKKLGRSVKADALLVKLLTLFEDRHIEELKDGSLSNKDRLEMQFQEYAAKHGGTSREEFFGVLLQSLNTKQGLDKASGIHNAKIQ